MNKLESYIYIDGKRFNAQKFAAGLRKELAGSAHPIYRMVKGSKSVVGEYWKSKAIQLVPGNFDKTIIALIREHRSAISRAKKQGAKRICVQIVCRMCDGDSMEGYFISRKLIAALHKQGIELDIDAVRSGTND